MVVSVGIAALEPIAATRFFAWELRSWVLGPVDGIPMPRALRSSAIVSGVISVTSIASSVAVVPDFKSGVFAV